MAGFFILMLFVVLAKYWYVMAGVFLLWLLWCFVIEQARQREAEHIREYQRHERARRDIERVTAATTRAMVDATREGR
jgi:p-aminobenzoyl-glutamate transporter AbgT